MTYKKFMNLIMKIFKQHLALIKREWQKSLASTMALILAVLSMQGAVFASVYEQDMVTEKTLENPKKDEKSKVVSWDVISFGHYYNKDTNGDDIIDSADDKQPILWRVLSVEGNRALLVSEYGVTARAYNEARRVVTWDNSTVRSFLNGYYKITDLNGRAKIANVEGIDYSKDNFIDEAFNAAEKSYLIKNIVPRLEDSGKDTEDYISLLSEADVENPDYGFDEKQGRRVIVTDYAKQMGAYTSGGQENYGIWRLRNTKSQYYRTSFVNSNGDVMTAVQSNTGAIHNKDEAIRPVITLDLNNSLWSYKGKIFSDGAKGDDTNIKTGKCGLDISFSIALNDDAEHVLTISGTGPMLDYELPQGTPWYQFSDDIKEVIIEDGITGIGLNCFSGLSKLERFTMPISIPCEPGQFTDVNTLKKITLTKGSGTSVDYDENSYNKTPWYACRKNKIQLYLSDDVDRIGSYYFYDCTGLVIPVDLKEDLIIGANAFGKTDYEETYASNDDITVRIYFDALEGSADFISKEVIFGKAYGELPEAELEGYLLRGWVLADGTFITSETLVGVKEEHTLFAVWMTEAEATAYAKATDSALATEAAASGTILPEPTIDPAATATAQAQATSDANATATAKANATATATTAKPVATATVDKKAACTKAQLTLEDKNIEIYFDLKDGEAPENFFELTTNGKKAKFIAPTMEGYTFSGWYNTASGKRVHYINSRQIDNYDGMILKAKWTENKYKLRYRLLRPSDNTPVKGRALGKTLKYTQYVTINDTVKAQGWRLAGWCTVPNSTIVKYAPGARVKQLAGKSVTDKNIVLYPVWVR